MTTRQDLLRSVAVGHPAISAERPLAAGVRPDAGYQGLDRIRLEWLVSFVAVSRCGGVSAAARSIFRSQPRVSCHIAELETVLGTTLLDRSTRPVELTTAGRALLQHAENILTDVRVLADGFSHGQVQHKTSIVARSRVSRASLTMPSRLVRPGGPGFGS